MSNNNTLYRKYRPQKFDQVVGQEMIVKSLQNNISKNELHHAYIFCGTRGTGKTTIAKIFAKAINCLNPINNDVCLECNNCKMIQNNETIDIVEIDAASNNGVDQVRTIIDNAQYLPQNLKTKVFIIDEAHMLTNSAWNALLKTIEEPPKHCIFIFATTEFHKIPLTIISRCVRYEFFKLSNLCLSNLITDVAKKEGLKISKEAIEKIVYLADGAARDALTILDQLKTYSTDINVSDINTVFGLMDNKFFLDFLQHYFNNQQDLIIKDLAVLKANNNHSFVINNLVDLCIDLISFLKTNSYDYSSKLSKKEIESLNCFNLNNLSKLLDILHTTLVDAKYNNQYWFYFKINLFKGLNDDSNDTNNNVEQPTVINQPKPATRKTTIKPQVDITTTIDDIQTYNNTNVDSLEPTSPIEAFKDAKMPGKKLSEFYETKTHLKNAEQPKVLNDEYYPIFEKLVFHNDKVLLKTLNEKFESLKNGMEVDPILKVISSANKIFSASNNVGFILFNNSFDTNKFNTLIKEKDNQVLIQKHFGDQVILLGIDEQTRLQYMKKAKEAKDTKKKVEKINEKDLNNILDLFDENELIQDIKEIMTK